MWVEFVLGKVSAAHETDTLNTLTKDAEARMGGLKERGETPNYPSGMPCLKVGSTTDEWWGQRVRLILSLWTQVVAGNKNEQVYVDRVHEHVHEIHLKRIYSPLFPNT